MGEKQNTDMNLHISSITHFSFICIALALVLCFAGPVSAITVADEKASMTITGENGSVCIPETLTINGTTNYNTDNRVMVEISPAEFMPTKKTDPQSFGGAAETVDVLAGTGRNFWTMSVNTTGWQPGMYLVQATIIGKQLIESEFITLDYCTDTA